MTPARIKRRKKQKAGLVVSAVLIVFCTVLLGVGVWLFFLESGGGGDSVAKTFQVEGLDPAAKAGSVGSPVRDRSLGEGKFGYRIENSPTFTAGGNGEINIENPAANKYLLVLELSRKDDPALLYQSQYIAPNQYIDKITLSKVPKAGIHDVTAYLNLVDPHTMKVVDILECPLKLTVTEK